MSICLESIGGTWQESAAPTLETCADVGGYWATLAADFVGLDAETILYVASWGAGVVLFMWSIGYTVGVALSVIRRV